MKIWARIFLFVALLNCVSFYCLIHWVIDDTRRQYLQAVEESMVDIATILSSSVAANVKNDTVTTDHLALTLSDVGTRSFKAKIYDLIKTEVALRVYVTDKDGMVIFDSDNGAAVGLDYSRWNDVKRTLTGQYGARTTRSDPRLPRTAVLYIASPINVDGKTVGVVSVGKSVSSVYTFIDDTQQNIIKGGRIVAAAVIVLSLLLALWITLPIRKLTAYAHAIRDGKRVQMPELGRDELGVMGAALEGMRDSLEGKQYVETYIQTLTHELATPVAAIRGAAELLEDTDMAVDQRQRFIQNIANEAHRIDVIVKRMVLLTELERRKTLQDVTRINVVDMLTDTVARLEPLAVDKSLTVVVDAPDEQSSIQAEEFLVRQALTNLLHNAIDFTPQNGRITLSSIVGIDGTVQLIVDNDGPTIPDYAIHRVFERFYSRPRPDSGTKSTGLGLSFVYEVAALHGGAAAIENRPNGVRATLTLPITVA